MRLVSDHISQWDVNFAGKWDSALKGNSALRAHVARAMGIELAHSEGQFVIRFSWDVRKFYDSIKAHLLIPQLVARGYPLEILVLGTLTHKSPRCLQVGNSYSNIIMGCASSILAGRLQSCSGARGLLFELVQALVYVVPGSVCEEHIDDLSQFVTNTSRIQLFQEAALIGKAVKEGTAKLGLALSCKPTLLANDKSLGKLIVDHLGDEGVPLSLSTSATDLGIETAAGKRRCAANQWKRIWCEGEVFVQGDEGHVRGVAQVVDCHGVTVSHEEKEEEEERQEVMERKHSRNAAHVHGWDDYGRQVRAA